jgi:CHAT domain-containing protein/tetratricopeptide (TPR) repeat protein
MEQRNWEEALACYRRSVEVSGGVFSTPDSWWGCGLALFKAGQTVEAMQNFVGAISATLDQEFVPKPLPYYHILDLFEELDEARSGLYGSRDTFATFQAQHEDTMITFKLGLDIFGHIGDLRGQGKILMFVVKELIRRHDTSKAITCLQQAANLWAITSPGSYDLFEAVWVLGVQFSRMGEFAKSEQYLRQAASMDTIEKEDKHSVLALLGTALLSLHRYSEGMSYLDDAHQMALELEASDSEVSDVDLTLYLYALALVMQGNFTEAHGALKKALKKATECNNEDLCIVVLNRLSELESTLGHYDNAYDLALEAKESAKTRNDWKNMREATLFLGDALLGMLEKEKALECFTEVQKSLKESGFRGDHAVWTRLANAFLSLDRPGPVLELISPETTDVAELHLLGQAYMAVGQHEKGLSLLLRAQASLDVSTTSSNRASLLGNLALCLRQMGRFNEAKMSLEKAIEEEEDAWANVRGNDSLSQSFFSTQSIKAYKALQDVQATLGDISGSLETCDRGKARALLDMMTKEYHKPVPRFSADQMRGVAKRLQATLVSYSFIPFDKPNPDEPHRHVARQWRLFIWVVPHNYDCLRFEEIPVDKSILAELELMFHHFHGSRREGEDELLTKFLQRNIYPDDLDSDLQPDTTINPKPLPGQLALLYDLLIRPIERYLPSSPEARVIFVPDRELFRVPFAALIDASNQTIDEQGNIRHHYFIEDHTCSVIGSIALLDMLKPSMVAHDCGELLRGDCSIVFANPLNGRRPPLPGAQDEGEFVAKELRCQSRLGNSASKEAAKEHFPGKILIHFCGHALSDMVAERDSWHSTVSGALVMAAPSSSVEGMENPEEGLLWASDIASMSLVEGGMVVLSGCNTGKGYITADGVCGLARAFLCAGTSTVVVSLWAVGDNPTKELMKAFYSHLLSNTAEAEPSSLTVWAMRQSMLELVSKYPNEPTLWAPFVVFGL